MAEHLNIQSLSIEMIDEYLAAASKLMPTCKEDGGIHGYAAALLMMAVIDSLGHAQSQRSGGFDSTILKAEPFCLSKAHCSDLKEWYRNGLVHTGTLAPNVYIRPETDGDPFMFDDEGKLNGIRVQVLLSKIKDIWEAKKPTHHPVSMNPQAVARTPRPSRRTATTATPPPSGYGGPGSDMAPPEMPEAE